MSRYSVWNCISGRHNRRHTFRRRNSRYKPTSTNILYYGLKVKGRKNGKAKTPFPCQRNRMLHAIKHRHNTSLRNYTRIIPPFLPFDEPNLCNDYIFIDPEYNNQSCFLNQVDSNSDLLGNMILQQVVIQSTKKTKECKPTQIKIEDNNVQKEIMHQKQEIQECKYATT